MTYIYILSLGEGKVKVVPATNYPQRHEDVRKNVGVTPLNLVNSALDRSEWSASSPHRFHPRSHRIGRWTGHKVGLDAVAKGKKKSSSLPRIKPQLPSDYLHSLNARVLPVTSLWNVFKGSTPGNYL
jgi:hypothetical protein